MNKKTSDRPVFPFTSIVGQEEMKLSLILNVIDPKIGGVMIMGDRGLRLAKQKILFLRLVKYQVINLL